MISNLFETVQIKEILKKCIPHELDEVTTDYVLSMIQENEHTPAKEFHEIVQDTVKPFVVTLRSL
jgi:hypothetical protein